MSEQKDSLYPPDWLNIARKDWERIYRMIKDEDAEAAGYFFQQALEKYLKAFLLQNGWALRKIHELDALLDDAVKYKPDLKNFYDLCERVSGYYFAERYPHLGETSLSCKDIEKDLEDAKEFIKSMFPDERFAG